MTKLDDAVLDSVGRAIGGLKSLIESKVFSDFLKESREEIFAVYRVRKSRQGLKPEDLVRAISEKLESALNSIKSTGVKLRLRAIRGDMMPGLMADDDFSVVRASYISILDIVLAMDPDLAADSEYLVSIISKVVYNDILYSSFFIPSVDIDGKRNANEMFEQMKSMAIIKWISDRHSGFLTALSRIGNIAHKNMIEYLGQQFSGSYSVYGSLQIGDNLDAGISRQTIDDEHRETAEVDYRILALKDMLIWNIILSALDIINGSSDRVLVFRKRRDVDGMEFDYEGQKEYSEESDRNSIILFLIYKVMSVPFSSAMKKFVQEMHDYLKRSKEDDYEEEVGLPPKISGPLGQGMKLLLDDKLSSSSISSLRDTQEKLREVAAKHIASALVSMLAYYTRLSMVPYDGIVIDGATSDRSNEKIYTPFQRMYAIYDTGHDLFWDHVNENSIRLNTKWEVLKKEHPDPTANIEVESPFSHKEEVEESGGFEVADTVNHETDSFGEPSNLFELLVDECISNMLNT